MEENTKRINDVYDYLIYRHIINGQEDMANALKTSRPNITSMLSGKKSVTTETLRKINEAFPNIFSLKWLLIGEPPMFIDDPLKTNNTSKSENVIDQSSLVNAALAAKDETIRSKDETIATLRDTIESLKRENTLLRQQLNTYRISEQIEHSPFSIGVADNGERTSSEYVNART